MADQVKATPYEETEKTKTVQKEWKGYGVTRFIQNGDARS